MRNSLTGIFFDDKGNEIFVNESYVRFDSPPVIYRKDQKGLWRCYTDSYKKGNRKFYRFFGFRVPLFAKI